MRVATVLRSGGDFGPEHVYRIRRMLNEHLPEHEFLCLTDVISIPWRIRLEHEWPGWWSKMEMCRPDLSGALLYMDLDTVILDDLSPFALDVDKSVVLRDLYRGKRDRKTIQSALMYLTEEDRARVWKSWTSDPEGWMRRLRSRGDQAVFEHVLSERCLFWQDTHPGMVVGYKSHLRRPGLDEPPDGARIVIFHGKPRPWDTSHPWAHPRPLGAVS